MHHIFCPVHMHRLHKCTDLTGFTTFIKLALPHVMNSQPRIVLYQRAVCASACCASVSCLCACVPACRCPVDVSARLLPSALRAARRSFSRGHAAHRLRALVREPGAVSDASPRSAAGGTRPHLLQLRRRRGRRRRRRRRRRRPGRRPPAQPAAPPIRVGLQQERQRRRGDVPLVPVTASLLSAVSVDCRRRLSGVFYSLYT